MTEEQKLIQRQRGLKRFSVYVHDDSYQKLKELYLLEKERYEKIYEEIEKQWM